VNKKILIIDDDDDVSNVLKELLEKIMFGFQVEVISSFSSAVSMAESERAQDYDAVLLDGQIKEEPVGGHGYDIAEKLRLNGYRGIIFSIAGHAFCDAVPVDKKWCFNGGYQKPVPFRELAGQLLDVWLK
jgi:DNA-binding response OmpR family regulator